VYAGSGSRNAIFGYDSENGQPEPIIADATTELMLIEASANSRGWRLTKPIRGLYVEMLGDGVTALTTMDYNCFKLFRSTGHMFSIDLYDATRTTRIWQNGGSGVNYQVAEIEQEGFQWYKMGNKKHTYGTVAPSTGTWNQGDMVYNTAPAAAGYIGWVCVTTGTPGVWKGFGLIQA
jgi:hypothetical protein